MRKLSFAGALLVALTFSASVMAQDDAFATVPDASDTVSKPMVAGAFMSMGMTNWVGDNGPVGNIGPAEPRFAGGAGAYFDYHLNSLIALEVGLGFVGTGYRRQVDMGTVGDVTYRTKFTNMEIPLGVKFSIFKGLQASAALAAHFVLGGIDKYKKDGTSVRENWSKSDWEKFRRANLALRFNVGYRIPIGPIALVPSLTWFFNLIKENKTNTASTVLAMNLMFNLGAEFGFGG